MRRTPETYGSTGVPALVSHTSHPPESRQLHPLKGASGVASAKASVLPSQASDRETEVRRARNTRQQQRLWGAVRSGWVVSHAWISRILGRTCTYDTVQQLTSFPGSGRRIVELSHLTAHPFCQPASATLKGAGGTANQPALRMSAGSSTTSPPVVADTVKVGFPGPLCPSSSSTLRFLLVWPKSCRLLRRQREGRVKARVLDATAGKQEDCGDQRRSNNPLGVKPAAAACTTDAAVEVVSSVPKAG